MAQCHGSGSRSASCSCPSACSGSPWRRQPCHLYPEDVGESRIDDFRDTLSKSLGLVFLLTIPSAIGLFFLSRPLVGVLYERGKFTPFDTEQMALALAPWVSSDTLRRRC